MGQISERIEAAAARTALEQRFDGIKKRRYARQRDRGPQKFTEVPADELNVALQAACRLGEALGEHNPIGSELVGLQGELKAEIGRRNDPAPELTAPDGEPPARRGKKVDSTGGESPGSAPTAGKVRVQGTDGPPIVVEELRKALG